MIIYEQSQFVKNNGVLLKTLKYNCSRWEPFLINLKQTNAELQACRARRVEMEDAHMAKTNLGVALEDWSYFAVFDGHAGSEKSLHIVQNIY
ncbi:hypothetical protein NQ317_000223 [Molorchus minor]|uniref:PPM-type phosphatase domain-containing protein n=1 Tax=Molorchus minor TaxID=1323400 RepID=A0ABQ9J8F7_9CUCU|nr:hypothetical protein NQ317_000223 [Molorchus minor]